MNHTTHPIYLLGFMGSGKTYRGKKWAAAAGISFYDLDDLIEEREGKTIREIFDEKGEEYFREIEKITLRNFKPGESYLMACGGGTPCFHNNMEWMNKNGTTVYLRSSPQNIFERLISEKDKRPLVKDISNEELQKYIETKIEEREQYYNHAELIIDSDKLDENSIPDSLK